MKKSAHLILILAALLSASVALYSCGKTDDAAASFVIPTINP